MFAKIFQETNMALDLHALVLADRSQIQQDAKSLDGAPAPILTAQDSGSGGMHFADSLKDAVQSVDQQEHLAAQKMADVDSGRSDDLVGAMLASQEASLSFSMLMQVRNKVMGAMDELIKLPV